MVSDYVWHETDDGLGWTCNVKERSIRMTAKHNRDNGGTFWTLYQNGDRIDGGDDDDLSSSMTAAEDCADQLIGT